MVKTIFMIQDMVCPACAMRLEMIEDKLNGVISVSASYQKQQMAVEYDESKIDEGQIVAEIERLGYHIAEAAL